MRLAPLLFAAGCAAPAAVVRPAPAPPAAEVQLDAALRPPLADAVPCSRGFSPAARHFAVDLPADEGTPVLASAAGRVVRASRHRQYGLTVILEHARLVYTLYAHLSSLAVEPGARVAAGETLGEVGRTGNASGPHLHFEVLEPPAPLPLRATGPIGVPGDVHRVDPAAAAGIPCPTRIDAAARR